MTRFLAPLLFGVLGTALLVALGLWQLARLEWKETMLAEIEARIADPAGPLPEQADPARDRFLPVRIEGRFETGELHVLVSQKGAGAGYRIIAPFETAAGRRVMVDRGIVPVPEKDAPRAPGAATVTGNLHWPDEVDRWTPEPDPDAGIWFARDVPRMAGGAWRGARSRDRARCVAARRRTAARLDRWDSQRSSGICRHLVRARRGLAGDDTLAPVAYQAPDALKEPRTCATFPPAARRRSWASRT